MTLGRLPSSCRPSLAEGSKRASSPPPRDPEQRGGVRRGCRLGSRAPERCLAAAAATSAKRTCASAASCTLQSVSIGCGSSAVRPGVGVGSFVPFRGLPAVRVESAGLTSTPCIDKHTPCSRASVARRWMSDHWRALRVPGVAAAAEASGRLVRVIGVLHAYERNRLVRLTFLSSLVELPVQAGTQCVTMEPRDEHLRAAPAQRRWLSFIPLSLTHPLPHLPTTYQATNPDNTNRKQLEGWFASL